MVYSDFDEILTDLKTRKWNLFHILTFCLPMIMLPTIIMGPIFLAPASSMTCDVSQVNKTVNITSVNECSYSYTILINSSLQTFEEECSKWILPNNSANTMTSEFSLVCSRSYLKPTYLSAMMLGSSIGSPLNGFLSDNYGRKNLHIFGITAVIIFSILPTLTSNFSFILGCRWISGLLSPCMTQTGYAMVVELLEPKYRADILILLSVPWALGMMWLGLLAYLVQDWRWLLRAFMLPLLIAWPLVWFYDESPRWLIVQGSLKRAQEILEKAFRWNNVDLPPHDELEEGIENIYEISLKNNGRKGPKANYSFLNKFQTVMLKVTLLCRTPEIRKRTFLMYAMHISGTLVYYGLNFGAANMGLNPFAFMAVSGMVELPAYFLSVPLVKIFGTIRPLIFSQVVCGVCILLLVIVNIYISNADYLWMKIVLPILGKFCISVSASLVWIIDAELLPTEVKVQMYGTAVAVSRIGSITATFITGLVGEFLPWFPGVLFGVITLMSAVVAWFIPQTRGAQIYGTVAQLEDEVKCNKRKKNVIDSAINADGLLIDVNNFRKH